MKAIVQDSYGAPEVLRLDHVEAPRVTSPDDVVVRVHAAGLDPGIWHIMTGLPYLIRIMGYGLWAPRTRIPGIDFAGTVNAVGAEVTRFRPGDEVFGGCRGSFAELACAKEKNLAPKPAELGFDQAAAIPVSASTALQGLRDVGKLEPGQQVLIIGAGGGIGTFAVQIARALGAEVTGVCSTAKADLVRSLGADHVIDYTRENLVNGRRRYDLILDTAGNRPLSHLRRGLTVRGTLVIVGGEGGGKWLAGTDRQLRALALSPFVRQSLKTFVAKITAEDLDFLAELVTTGRMTPVIERTYALCDAADAIRHWMKGHARGKTVITV